MNNRTAMNRNTWVVIAGTFLTVADVMGGYWLLTIIDDPTTSQVEWWFPISVSVFVIFVGILLICNINCVD